MSVRVTLKNEKTGELKQVKVGWSWILFLFSGLFGLPLFLRRLYVWGGIFLILWVANFYFIPSVEAGSEGEIIFASISMIVIFLCLQIWLGIKGNEMTAKNYLENGWIFSNLESDDVKFAKQKWRIE